MDDSNSKNNTNNLYKVIEHLEEDNEALKSDRDALRQRHDQLEDDIEQYKRENEIFHRLLEHFDSTAFMNFNTYRDDRPLKKEIKRLKEH